MSFCYNVFVNRSKVFSLALLSFVGGVFLASFFYPAMLDASVKFFLLLAAVMLGLFFYPARKFFLLPLTLVFLAGGFWWTERKIDLIDELSSSERFFSGRGVVSYAPVEKEFSREMVFVPEGEKVGFLVRTNVFSGHEYGEEWELECQLKIPQNQEGSKFDYRMYLAKENIFYLCLGPRIKKTGAQKGNMAYQEVLWFKDELGEKLSRLVPFPEAGLLEGLLIGGSGKLSKEIREQFSRTGMTHIVAVSGYNITIVAQYLLLLGIALGLWRRQAFWFAVGGLWFFVLLTGLPASAVRAGVMGTLLLYAMKSGRLANAGNAVLFSAAVMLVVNLLLLRYDIGFQLSFLATMGIIYLYSPLERLYGQKWKNQQAFCGFVFEILVMSLSAQMFVLPIILFNFGTLSLVSPLANMLVLPILPITMFLGFLMVLAGFIFYPLAVPLSWLVYLPLRYEILIIGYLAKFEFSALDIGLSWQGVLVWYIILIGGVYLLQNRQSDKKRE